MSRPFVGRALHLSVLAVFFFVGWWFRPPYSASLSGFAYFFGFLITLPVLLALTLWLVAGLPGLREAWADARRGWLIGLSALAGYVLLSPLWSTFPAPSRGAADQFGMAALFGILLLCAAPPPRAVVGALMTGLLISAVVMVVQFGRQESVGLGNLGELWIAPDRAAVSVVVADGVRLIRPYGLTAHPNIAAGALMAALVAASAWLSDQQVARWRWAVRTAALVLGIWALALSFSRAALGGLVVGLTISTAAMLLTRRVSRPRLVGAGALVGLTLAVFAAIYYPFLLARAGVGQESPELISVAMRRVLIDMGLQVFREYPVLGVGMGAGQWEAAQRLVLTPYGDDIRAEHVHNVPLLILSELGVVGFGLWALLLAYTGWAALRHARDPYGAALLAAGIALLAVGLFDHYPWTIFQVTLLLWGCLGAGLGAAFTSRKP